MTEIEIIKIIVNLGGYAAMCVMMMFMVRDLARAFLRELIVAVRENTAANAKLAEKIDQLTRPRVTPIVPTEKL